MCWSPSRRATAARSSQRARVSGASRCTPPACRRIRARAIRTAAARSRKWRGIGFDLQHTEMTGGGSDGNFTAALGVPTLDGLGIDGDGAHTEWEHGLISSIEPRTLLMRGLLETLA